MIRSRNQEIEPCGDKRIPKQNKNDAFLWADVIRSGAIVLVLVIHVADLVVRKWQDVPELWWHTANVFGALARPAVPLFVMLSGALLLGRRETWDVFVKKRLMRILIPLLAWSAIFFLYRYFYQEHTFTLESVLKGLYSGHAYFHLWYFYMLFGLYLLLPLLRILVQHASKHELIYMISLWFFVVSLNASRGNILDSPPESICSTWRGISGFSSVDM